MNITLISIKAVCELIIMGLVGFAAAKTKLLSNDSLKTINVLLKDVCMLCLLISVGFREYDPSCLGGILWAFLLAAVGQIIGLPIAWFLFRKKETPHNSIDIASCGASNVGFIGTAVVTMIMGPEMLLYMAGPIVACNLLLWTADYGAIRNHFDKKDLPVFFRSKIAVCLAAGLLLYFLPVRIPAVISEPISTIGSMTGPLAMIAAGIMLAETDVRPILKSGRTYAVMLIKLFAAPLLLLLLMVPMISYNPDMYGCSILSVICCACPIPSLLPVIAAECDRDAHYSSGLLAVSLVISMAAIPVDVMICDLVLKAFVV